MNLFYRLKDYDIFLDEELVAECDLALNTSSHSLLPIVLFPKEQNGGRIYNTKYSEYYNRYKKRYLNLKNS